MNFNEYQRRVYSAHMSNLLALKKRDKKFNFPSEKLIEKTVFILGKLNIQPYSIDVGIDNKITLEFDTEFFGLGVCNSPFVLYENKNWQLFLGRGEDKEVKITTADIINDVNIKLLPELHKKENAMNKKYGDEKPPILKPLNLSNNPEYKKNIRNPF